MEANLIYLLRMLIAGLCGIAIGFERKNRSKEAGVRTHCVVACAAALMMILSKYAYFDLITDASAFGAEVRLDPSRVASTIVSGIGFLGTGMIFVHKQSITGLTTAAGIWATAGIGMALGAGMYFVGVSATFLILLIQIVLHSNAKFFGHKRTKTLMVYDVEDKDYQKQLTQLLNSKNITVAGVEVTQNGENSARNYEFILELPWEITEDEIVDAVNKKCSLKNR